MNITLLFALTATVFCSKGALRGSRVANLINNLEAKPEVEQQPRQKPMSRKFSQSRVGMFETPKSQSPMPDLQATRQRMSRERIGKFEMPKDVSNKGMPQVEHKPSQKGLVQERISGFLPTQTPIEPKPQPQLRHQGTQRRIDLSKFQIPKELVDQVNSLHQQVKSQLVQQFIELNSMKSVLVNSCPHDFYDQIKNIDEAIKNVQAKERSVQALQFDPMSSRQDYENAKNVLERVQVFIDEVSMDVLSELEDAKEAAEDCKAQRAMALEMINTLREQIPRLSKTLLKHIQEYQLEVKNNQELKEQSKDLGLDVYYSKLEAKAKSISERAAEAIILLDRDGHLFSEDQTEHISTSDIIESSERAGIAYNQANEIFDRLMEDIANYNFLYEQEPEISLQVPDKTRPKSMPYTNLVRSAKKDSRVPSRP